MTQCIKFINRENGHRRKLLATASLCLSLMLASCDNGGSLLHVKDAFKQPIPAPPSGIDKNINDSMSHMAKGDTADTTPMNTKNLFGQNAQSDQDRLDRLERAVQDMRNDFDMVQPSIRRLMAIESDIQRLVSELARLNADVTPARSTPKAKKTSKLKASPVSAPSKKNFVTKSPPPVSSQASIYDVRIGEHPGKTRIVMDTNSKTSFSVDIDNNEKIMVIDLPNAGWSASTSKSFGKSPYISSYKVEASGDGHIAIFQLKKSVKITYKDDLKGFEGNSRRIVIDISGS